MPQSRQSPHSAARPHPLPCSGRVHTFAAILAVVVLLGLTWWIVGLGERATTPMPNHSASIVTAGGDPVASDPAATPVQHTDRAPDTRGGDLVASPVNPAPGSVGAPAPSRATPSPGAEAAPWVESQAIAPAPESSMAMTRNPVVRGSVVAAAPAHLLRAARMSALETSSASALDANPDGQRRTAFGLCEPDGSFLLELPASGLSWVLCAQADECAPAFVPLSRVVQDVDGLALRLERGAVIEGTLRAQDGAPVAGAFICAGAHVARDEIEAAVRATASDARGRYRIGGLPAFRHSVRVVAEGFACIERSIELSPGATLALDLVLETEAKLAGEVQDSLGLPVEGAFVIAEGRGGERSSAVTDARGAFRLSGVGTPSVLISVESRAFLPWERRFESHDDALRIVLEDGARFAGLVRDAESRRPIAAATVMALVRHDSGDGKPVEAWATSDDTGQFELALRDESTPIRIARDDYLAAEFQVEPRFDGATTEFLLARGARLWGTLCDRSGQAVVEALVRIHPAVPAGGASGAARAEGGAVTTSSDLAGRFLSPALVPGRYAVHVTHRDFLDWRKQVEIGGPNAEVVCTLERGATVAGSVTYAGGGVPTAGALYLESDTVRRRTGFDASGEFRFMHVPPGAYRVRFVGLGGGEPAIVPVEVPAGEEPTVRVDVLATR